MLQVEKHARSSLVVQPVKDPVLSLQGDWVAAEVQIRSPAGKFPYATARNKKDRNIMGCM